MTASDMFSVITNIMLVNRLATLLCYVLLLFCIIDVCYCRFCTIEKCSICICYTGVSQKFDIPI